jgi:hypothetical protein
MAVLPNGVVRDAVASGDVSIRNFAIGPDGKVYVDFVVPINLATGQAAGKQTCVLAVVDPNSGAASCVDTGIVAVEWVDRSDSTMPPLQFDDHGGVYFYGYPRATTSGPVIRRAVGGVGTSLTTPGVERVFKWAVAPNGTLIYSGESDGPNGFWTRVRPPGGAVTNLLTVESFFMAPRPDGKFFLEAGNGVALYDPTTNQVESKYWFSASTPNNVAPYFSSASWTCDMTPWGGSQSATCPQSQIEAWLGRSPSGQMFVRATLGTDQLLKFYPTVHQIDTALKTVQRAEVVGDDRVVVAGPNQDGKNVLELVDASSGSTVRTVLVGADNEIKVDRLTHDAAQNIVLFEGTQLATNKYVIGEVNLATGQLQLLNAGTTKWADLQPLA